MIHAQRSAHMFFTALFFAQRCRCESAGFVHRHPDRVKHRRLSIPKSAGHEVNCGLIMLSRATDMQEHGAWTGPQLISERSQLTLGLIICSITILDHKASLQSCDLGRKTCRLHRVQDFVKVLVGGRRFVFGVRATVGQNIKIVK